MDLDELLTRVPSAENVAALRDYLEKNELVEEKRAAVWKFLLAPTAPSGFPANHAMHVREVLVECMKNGALCSALDEKGAQRVQSVVMFLCSGVFSAMSKTFLGYVCEVVAVFVGLGMSEMECYSLSASFFRVFAPQLLTKEPLFVSNSMAELLRLLLSYYDPQLCLYMEQRGSVPKIYAHKWLTSVFAAIAPADVVHKLWDKLIRVRDSLFMLPLCAAFVIVHREEIMKIAEREELAKFMAGLTLDTPEKLEQVFAKASEMNKHVVSSFKKQLHGVITRGVDSKKWIESNIWGSVCMHVSVLDVLAEKKKSKPIFIIDCRSNEEFSAGTIPTAFSMPISHLLDSPEEYKQRVEGIRSLQEESPQMHLVLFGRGSHRPSESGSADLNTLVLMLLRDGFKHISMIQNGYVSIHNQAMKGTLELAQHNKRACLVCRALSNDLFETDPSKPVIGFRSTFSSLIGSAQETFKKVKDAAAAAPTFEQLKDRAENALNRTRDMVHQATQRSNPNTAPIMETVSELPADVEEEAPKVLIPKAEPKPAPADPATFTIDEDEKAEKEEKAEEIEKAEEETVEENKKEEEEEEEEEEKEEPKSDATRLHDWVVPPNEMWNTTIVDEKEETQQGNRFVVLTTDEVIFLTKDETDPALVHLENKFDIGGIEKVAVKKSSPKHVILKFKSHPEAMHFLIDEPQTFIRAAKQRFLAKAKQAK